MNQEEFEKDFNTGENAFDSPAENSGEAAKTDSQTADKIPVESIGSYGRLDESSEDESSESSSKSTTRS